MNQNQKKVVVVFGGSGLLGIHCDHVLKHNYEVILTYNSNPITINNSLAFNASEKIKGIDKILRKYQPDIIINALALVTVDGCESMPDLARSLNKDFVADLVFSMKKNNLNKTHLIQISSDSVYGEQKYGVNTPWVETDELNPLSVYATTKLEGEIEAKKHSGPVSVLRTAFYGINPYSSHGLLWWIIDSAHNKKEINGWENIHFSPISATRFVEVIELMIEKSYTGTFNVGSVDSCNKFDYLETVCIGIGYPAKINRVSSNFKGDKFIRPTYSVLDTQKLSSLIPWKLDWHKDLNWYLKNSLSYPQLNVKK